MTNYILFSEHQSAGLTGVGKFSNSLKESLGKSVIKCFKSFHNNSFLRFFEEIYRFFYPIFFPQYRYIASSERQLLFLTFSQSKSIAFIHDERLFSGSSILSKIIRLIVCSKSNISYIAVSKYTASALRNYVSCSLVLYNPVETLSVTITPKVFAYSSSNTTIDIALCSSFEPRKNIHFLPFLAESLPNIRFSLYSSTFYVSRCQPLLLDQINTSPNISLFQNFSDIQLFRALSKSDLFLSLSEFEGFGRTIIEAQSLGLPVLALRNNVTEEVLADSAVIFPSLDLYQLKKSLQLLLDSYTFYSHQSIFNSQRFSLKAFQASLSLILKSVY